MNLASLKPASVISTTDGHCFLSKKNWIIVQDWELPDSQFHNDLLLALAIVITPGGRVIGACHVQSFGNCLSRGQDKEWVCFLL